MFPVHTTVIQTLSVTTQLVHLLAFVSKDIQEMVLYVLVNSTCALCQSFFFLCYLSML